jgi:hypothetical protein
MERKEELRDEEVYWRENYRSRPYVTTGAAFDDWGPAYMYGFDNYGRYGGRAWDEVEPELGRGWTGARGQSSLDWEKAKQAACDAWNRMIERRRQG